MTSIGCFIVLNSGDRNIGLVQYSNGECVQSSNGPPFSQKNTWLKELCTWFDKLWNLVFFCPFKEKLCTRLLYHAWLQGWAKRVITKYARIRFYNSHAYKNEFPKNWVRKNYNAWICIIINTSLCVSTHYIKCVL